MKMTQHHQISLMWPFIQRFCSTWMRWLKSENKNTVLNNSYEKDNSIVMLESAVRQTMKNVCRLTFFIFYLISALLFLVNSSRICITAYQKFFKLSFSSMWTENFQMFKLDLEKAEKPEIKLPTSTGSSKKQGNSKKKKHLLLLHWLC